MSTSIGKLSKSFFVKLLVGIIILPFVFWGMGDVFRGGNQNVIATIDSKKLSTQEFMNYLNRLNLNESEIRNLPNTNLVEKILSEYIGRKVMALEIEKMNILVSDKSLREIIKSDKLFFKDKKFSRTAYEKFLLEGGLTAPSFEKNIAEQESRRQFLSFLSGGILVPKSLVEKAFKKENQIKTLKYIDLNKYHSARKPTQEELNKLYDENKKFFVEVLKSIQFAEVTPQIASGKNEYDENFFKKLDLIENKILDGQSFEDAIRENNLKSQKIDGAKPNDKETNKISKKLLEKFFTIKNLKIPEIIKFDNKYYVVEVFSEKKITKTINDKDVVKSLNAQFNFKNKIKNNTSIVKDISLGGFDKVKMQKFAKDNNLVINDYKVSNLKQNDVFNQGILKRIFAMKDDEVDLITDNTLTKNFLVLAIKTEYKELQLKSNEFDQYKAKARLDLVNKIFSTYDNNLNQKYKVELNERTIERVKNSF